MFCDDSGNVCIGRKYSFFPLNIQCWRHVFNFKSFLGILYSKKTNFVQDIFHYALRKVGEPNSNSESFGTARHSDKLLAIWRKMQ